MQNIKAHSVIKHILIIVSWPIISLLMASAIMVLSSRIFDYDFHEYWVGFYIRLLAMALIESGFLAYYGRHGVSKITAFLTMAIVPCSICFFSLPLSMHVCLISPWVVFAFLKAARTDWGVNVIRVVKNILAKRSIRISISIYLVWACFVIFVHSSLFETIFEIEFYNPARALFLLSVPPILALMSLLLVRWCKKGKA